MNVLWITEKAIDVDEKNKVTGSWVFSLIKRLVDIDNVTLAEAYPSVDTVRQPKYGGTINLYPFLAPGFNKNKINIAAEELEVIIRDFKPDVIHVWGYENAKCYATILAADKCGLKDRVVVHMQGIINYYSDVLKETGIPLFYRLPLRPIEWVSGGSVYSMQKNFHKAAYYEKLSAKLTSHMMGRTFFDSCFAMEFNSDSKYHYCREILREEFYTSQKWDVNSVEKYSIFFSEAHYPIKGLHQLFKAVKILKNKYPEIKLYIAGEDMTANTKKGKQPWDMIPAWAKRNGYQNYLYRLSQKLGIADNIIYTKRLDAASMRDKYLSCHAYVCSSIIENGSNSLSEARILGTPSVAAFVGGMPDRMKNGEDVLMYPYNEPWQLAFCLDRIFSDDEYAMSMSKKAIESESAFSDPDSIMKELLGIYEDIASER